MQNTTAPGPKLSMLTQMIIGGWPDHISDASYSLW